MNKFLDYIKSENDHTIRFDKHFIQKNQSLNIRPVVFNEINKFISCGSKNNGFSVYECDYCR